MTHSIERKTALPFACGKYALGTRKNSLERWRVSIDQALARRRACRTAPVAGATCGSITRPALHGIPKISDRDTDYRRESHQEPRPASMFEPLPQGQAQASVRPNGLLKLARCLEVGTVDLGHDIDLLEPIRYWPASQTKEANMPKHYDYDALPSFRADFETA